MIRAGSLLCVAAFFSVSASLAQDPGIRLTRAIETSPAQAAELRLLPTDVASLSDLLESPPPQQLSAQSVSLSRHFEPVPRSAAVSQTLSGCGDCGECGEACCDPCWYASLSLDASRLFGSTFGVNLANEVPAGISGSGSGSSNALGGAIGRYIPICLFDHDMRLRAEVQGIDRHDFDIMTGPAGTPASQYMANIGDVWSLTANLWLDIPVTERFGAFGGFGLGAAGYDIRVANQLPPASFLAVRGSGNETQFAYTFGAGVYYQLTRRVTVDVGWRYFDLGDSTVNLFTTVGGFGAGTYQMDLDSHELLVNLRIDLY